MKKIISLLLVVAMMLSIGVVAATAEEPATKGFVIDGELDDLYIGDPTKDPALEENAWMYGKYLRITDGYNAQPGQGQGQYPFDEPETYAEAFIAYDDTYVYFYVKVWDNDLYLWETKTDDEPNSSWGDSIEIWYDPDPGSREKYDHATLNPGDPDAVSKFTSNVNNDVQGDTHFRMQAANFKVDDYHGKNQKPGAGYNGELLGDYLQNTDNVCGFHFDSEPRIIEATGETVSSGYGIECRLPRNDDENKCFLFNIAVYNSSPEDYYQRYALAIGSAWWLSYAGAFKVNYETPNPFLNADVTPEPPQTNTNVLATGDVNEDTKIDAADALEVLKAAVGKITLSEAQSVAANVNGDDAIDAADALDILKYAVGKITEFAVDKK